MKPGSDFAAHFATAYEDQPLPRTACIQKNKSKSLSRITPTHTHTHTQFKRSGTQWGAAAGPGAVTEACRHRPGGGSPLSHLPRPGLWKAGPGQASATLPGCPRPRFPRSLPRRRPGWREEAGGCRQARRLRGAEARAAMLGPPGRLHPAQAATAPVGRVPSRGGRAAPPATTTPSRCRDRGASRLSAPPLPPASPQAGARAAEPSWGGGGSRGAGSPRQRLPRRRCRGATSGGAPSRLPSPPAPPHTERSGVRRAGVPLPLSLSSRGALGHRRSPPPPRPPPPPPRPAPGRAPAPPLRADPFPPSCLARAAPLLTPPRGSSPPPPPPHSRLETVGTDAPASRPLPPFGAAAEPASPCRQPGPLLPPPAAPGTGPGKSRCHHQTERTTDGRTERPTHPPRPPRRGARARLFCEGKLPPGKDPALRGLPAGPAGTRNSFFFYKKKKKKGKLRGAKGGKGRGTRLEWCRGNCGAGGEAIPRSLGSRGGRSNHQGTTHQVG